MVFFTSEDFREILIWGKSSVLQNRHMFHGAFHHGFRRGAAEFFEHIPVNRSRVHPDSNGRPRIHGRKNHFFDRFQTRRYCPD